MKPVTRARTGVSIIFQEGVSFLKERNEAGCSGTCEPCKQNNLNVLILDCKCNFTNLQWKSILNTSKLRTL